MSLKFVALIIIVAKLSKHGCQLTWHSWVMLDESTKAFVCLPRERILLTSPARTSLNLQTPNSYPGTEPLSIKCADGKGFITTQRASCYFLRNRGPNIANNEPNSWSISQQLPQLNSNHCRSQSSPSRIHESLPPSSALINGRGY